MNPDKFDTKACLTAALEHTNTLYITLQKACTEIEQLRSELFNVRGELFDARQQLERYGAGIWCARCNAHFDTVGMTFDEQNAVMNAHFEECPNNPRAAELKTLHQQLAEAQVEKVQAERKAFVAGADWWSDGDDYIRASETEAATRYPDPAPTQAQCEAQPQRPPVTREQVLKILNDNVNATNDCGIYIPVRMDSKEKATDAIMALFTDSAGGADSERETLAQGRHP